MREEIRVRGAAALFFGQVAKVFHATT